MPYFYPQIYNICNHQLTDEEFPPVSLLFLFFTNFRLPFVSIVGNAIKRIAIGRSDLHVLQRLERVHFGGTLGGPITNLKNL